MRKTFITIALALVLLLQLIPAAGAADGEAPVTREYAIAAFVDAAGDNLKEEAADLSVYKDAQSISEEYRDKLALAVGNEIVKGSEGKLRPQDTISRVEAMTILARCLGSPSAVREPIAFTDVPE